MNYFKHYLLTDPGEVYKLEMKITSGFPTPTVTYDCTFESIKLKNEKIASLPCSGFNKYSGEIIREWEATDQSGNISECVQTVRLLTPNIDEIKVPDTFTIDCSKTLHPEHLLPSITGSPTFDDAIIGEHCNVITTYSDKIIFTCGNAFIMQREWTYGTFCTGEFKKETQIIIVSEIKGPQIQKDTIEIGTNLFTCDGTLKLEDLGIEDKCSGVKDIKAYYSNLGAPYNPNGQLQIVNFTKGEIMDNLPIGLTGMRIVAQDSCGNTLDTIVNARVSDTTSPQIIFDNPVEMGADSCRIIYAEVIGGGSADNCSAIDLKIRFSGDSIWQDSILVCCGKNAKIGVELRAEDAYNNVSVDAGNISLSCDTINAVSNIADSIFKLYQNTPNPFQNETVIGFYLQKKEFAILEIYDINGKSIHSVQGEYSKGKNEIKVNESLSSGVYFYQLKTKTHSKTKKMIVL